MSRVGITNKTSARTSKTTLKNVENMAIEWKMYNEQLKRIKNIMKQLENDRNKLVATNVTNMTPNQIKKQINLINQYEISVNTAKKKINKVRGIKREINKKGKEMAKKFPSEKILKIARNLGIKE